MGDSPLAATWERRPFFPQPEEACPSKFLPIPISEPVVRVTMIWVLAPFDFRVKGRSGKTGRVLVDTVRHADPGAAVEAGLGPLAWFGTPDVARGPEPAAPGSKAAPTPRPWEWTDPPPGYA